MNVTWHVDDLKTSHIDPFQNTKFAVYLTSIYSKGLVLHRGKVHDYLGMDLNYSINEIAPISMINYKNQNIHRLPQAYYHVVHHLGSQSPLHHAR
jgi:hypothetical protein